jgi:hypothetical protein
VQGAASLNKNEDDLINDTKDAGEEGAASAATVFHEIVPWGFAADSDSSGW